MLNSAPLTSGRIQSSTLNYVLRNRSSKVTHSSPLKNRPRLSVVVMAPELGIAPIALLVVNGATATLSNVKQNGASNSQTVSPVTASVVFLYADGQTVLHSWESVQSQ
jgi:hypothetical protein